PLDLGDDVDVMRGLQLPLAFDGDVQIDRGDGVIDPRGQPGAAGPGKSNDTDADNQQGNNAHADERDGAGAASKKRGGSGDCIHGQNLMRSVAYIIPPTTPDVRWFPVFFARLSDRGA